MGGQKDNDVISTAYRCLYIRFCAPRRFLIGGGRVSPQAFTFQIAQRWSQLIPTKKGEENSQTLHDLKNVR